MDKAEYASNLTADVNASEGDSLSAHSSETLKGKIASYLSAISKAFDEVRLSALPSKISLLDAYGKPLVDRYGRLQEFLSEQAKLENVRVLVARKGLYEGELEQAKEAISHIFDDARIMLARINNENKIMVSLQNSLKNRAALSNIEKLKNQAVTFVARALKANVGGYLKVRTLASDNDLMLAEKALRILGFDIRGAQETPQILKPKTAKDAEVVDMVFAYQETQPLNVIANKFSMGRVTRLLRIKNDNSKKLVRC